MPFGFLSIYLSLTLSLCVIWTADFKCCVNVECNVYLVSVVVHISNLMPIVRKELLMIFSLQIRKPLVY